MDTFIIIAVCLSLFLIAVGSIALLIGEITKGTRLNRVCKTSYIEPRLWFVISTSSETGKSDWFIRYPITGKTSNAINEQKITSIIYQKDNSVIETVYNHALEEVSSGLMDSDADSGQMFISKPRIFR